MFHSLNTGFLLTILTDGDIHSTPEHLDDDIDLTDANTFEMLLQHGISAPAVYPEAEPPNGDLFFAPPPECASDVPIQPETGNSETGNSETGSTQIVDRFPHGQPGAPVLAPVTGTPQSATVYESTQDILGESVWAPFDSQCDWELAYWAKMRGPTSSAVTDLLAIPGVSSISMCFVTY